ncbi:MAG TPA: acetyl-CoA carboxylase biotin carboxyl carrier protein subunit [Bacteroidales bacterium]|nr:acetyl-CoA carboxylase biotin carboxyl carrier protein subunit [Bacteroidales bacterium]
MENTPENPNSTPLQSFKVGDDEYFTIVPQKFLNRKAYQTPNPKIITSFMPGNIPDVFVMIGDVVVEGQKLCTLEAMKMKNVIYSPCSGTVKSINVEPGKMVPKNFVLIEIE